MTSEETLKQLSDAIEAYASAKVSNNEQLIRFSIANIQQFLNAHSITPIAQPAGEAGVGTEADTKD